MKNTIKIIGIIAMVVVIGFSMAACGDGAGTDYSGGGTEVISSSGEVTVSDWQVYTMTQNMTNFTVTYTYTPYTGDMTLESGFGTATIIGGKLSFTLGTPALDSWTPDRFSYWTAILSERYDTLTASDPSVKGSLLAQDMFSTDRYYLSKGYCTFSGSLTSGTVTFEDVMYLYVDRDVTISGTGKTSTYTEEGKTHTTKTENFSLALKAGWNVIYNKTVDSINSTNETATMTRSLANPSHLRWFLVNYDD